MALVAVLIVTALWAAGIDSTWLPPSVQVVVSDVGQFAAALCAAVACLIRSRPPTPVGVRRFWFYLGAGCGSWAFGQLLWSVYELILHHDAPLPSAADLGYLLMPPLVAAALLSSPLAAGTVAGRLRSLLDGLLVALSALLVGWILILRTVLQAGGDNPLALVVSLAYPIGDVVLITVLVYASLTRRRVLSSDRAAYIVMATGLLAITAADLGFAYLSAVRSYATGGLPDVGWFGGFLVVAVATLFRGEHAGPRGHEEAGSGSLAATFLPYVAVGVALIGSTIDLVDRGSFDEPVSWFRTAIICLLVARQLFTLLENRSLTTYLETRVELRTAELRASRQRFAALVAHSSDVTMVLDRCGTINYLSDASERVLGWPPAALLGANIATAIGSAAESAALLAALEHTAEEPLRIHTISSTWTRGGERRSLELTLTNLLDNPDVSGIVLNIHNVTDRKLLEEQLVHQAFHDALTGMANRAHFRGRLEIAVDRRASSSGGVSVLFMDLDGFKMVNDTLGHGVGDTVLCEVADRIIETVGDSGVVARIGGDEFAVLVEGSPDHGHLAALADRITSTLRRPLQLDGREIHLAGSIGIADLTSDVATAEQLLRNADLAMYEAKSAGDGGFAFFEPAMHNGLVERVRLEEDLRSSLETDDFEVHYQPLLALDTGRVTGVEALVRWRHPTRGLVDPADFISAAESTGLIRPLGQWVLETACRQGARWQQDAPDPDGLKVSVNMSARQFGQPDLVDRIAQTLDRTGLPASCLVLEMTEGVLMVDSAATLETLTGIRELGIRVAIDDFGTGYSSLSYLHHFTVDILKIDRSFIKGLAAGQDAALVRSIIQLAQSMGLETVAEGIEREYELRLLRELGCTTGQGYYFSPPVPAAMLSGILARQRDRTVVFAEEPSPS